VVYLATDMTLGRKLALKTLPAATEALAARLQHEARTMAHVRHPHLASIYGAEQWRGAPVLLVEFLEGGTLLDWLRRGPFTVDEALSLGIVLADALDCLHRAGILHRDVKPSNIGYTLTGEAKLLDLGLAATIQGHEDRLDAPASDDLPGSGDPGHQTPGGRGHSQSGPLLGTLRYMAPEALEGNPPGPSLDLWSLAFVLYEAIAGRHPLAELAAEDLVGRVRQGLVPDLRESSPDCPASVAAFFRDALSPVLERRPQSAATFRAALQHLRAELLAA
jgi:serine/threonine-protein kinase